MVEAPEGAQPTPSDATPHVVAKARARRVRIAFGLIVLVVIAALGASAVYANATLSSRYSAGQATLDYFAAQERGDAAGMMANATFLRAGVADEVLFNQAAVAAMLKVKPNTDLGAVRILSTAVVDSSTARVKVAMTWAGDERTTAYTVRKDPKRTQLLFFNSWRVDVPPSIINVSLPDFAGSVSVDGIFRPGGPSSGPIQVIPGYHRVAMLGTPFYDGEGKVANAIDVNPKVTFVAAVSDSAKTSIAELVSGWFTGCNASTHNWCPNHTYSAPDDGRYWYWLLPGYGKVYYKTYMYTIDPDLISGMNVVVTAYNKASATGTCRATLIVDGSREYSFTGGWAADISVSGSYFNWTSSRWDCTKDAA